MIRKSHDKRNEDNKKFFRIGDEMKPSIRKITKKRTIDAELCNEGKIGKMQQRAQTAYQTIQTSLQQTKKFCSHQKKAKMH